MKTKPRHVKTSDGKPVVLWMDDDNYSHFLHLEESKNIQRFGVVCLHREDGPAWIEETCEEWYYKNVLHCITGPAKTIRGIDNSVVLEFFVNNIWITPKIEDWASEVEIDLTNMSDNDRALLSIKLSSFM